MNMTVGPLPPAVYWRRRALVGVPLLAILIAFSTCLASGSDGKPPAKEDSRRVAQAQTSEPNPSASSSADEDCTAERPCGPESGGAQSPTASTAQAPDPTASAPASPQVSWSPAPTAVACADRDLILVALADKPAYPVGAEPRFKLAVTNGSSKPCLRDVGSSQQELKVSAGATRLWSSDDCSPNRGTDPRVLQPGEKRTYWLTWSGRTSQAGCPKTRTEVGPGSYQLTARLGTLLSRPVAFSFTR